MSSRHPEAKEYGASDACKHPVGPNGLRVCGPEQPEPDDQWPTQTWACWWVAVQSEGKPFLVYEQPKPKRAYGLPYANTKAAAAG